MAKEAARSVLVGVWKVRGRFGPAVKMSTDHRVGVVLLSYNREQNLDPIVRAVQKCSFVHRIILSNNNPQKRFADFISAGDERLVCIDQTERQRPGNRWGIAREHLGDCSVILAIDDDVFLYPRQIRQLITKAIDDPASVHGFAGMIGHQYVAGHDMDVDHVVRVYALTPDHIGAYFGLIERMQEHREEVERIGDDIVISLAAEGTPRIHSIGPVLSCASSTESGVAVNREDDFTAVRDLIYAEACRVRRDR